MGKRARLVAFALCAAACATKESHVSSPARPPTPVTSGPGDAIEVAARPVPLNPTDPSQQTLGPLRYRGGLALSSRDARFGGLSDLRVDPDGAGVVGITDEGGWWTARLVYDDNGRLTGFVDARVGRLHDLEGRLLPDKDWQDAESLARLPNGVRVVGFERHQRLWQYGADSLDGHARAFATPPGLDNAPRNGGIEAMTSLRDGRLLALTEELKERGTVRGWVECRSAWSRLNYRYERGLRPSGAATLPSGDVLILDRAFDRETGVEIRIQRVKIEDIRPGAILEGTTVARMARPLTVDNFEGIDAGPGAPGESLLYLVSDDNFDGQQRTLLLVFALDDGPPVPTVDAGHAVCEDR